MATRFRYLFRIALLAALLVSSSACNIDGSGSGTQQLFFGTNNIHECNPITIDIDLAAANATVARRSDGSLDCDIDASLAGCNAIFTETAGGDSLNIVVGGCDVPPIASLFACEFSGSSRSAIAQVTSAMCDCVGEPACHLNIFCLERPSICVAQEANPSACEDCFNGEDDDGDGFLDCNDRDCAIENCGFGQTTITCSTSTSTLVSASTTLP